MAFATARQITPVGDRERLFRWFPTFPTGANEMLTLAKIDEKLKEIAAKQKAILDAADENGGSLSEEQRGEWANLSTEYTSLKSRREIQEAHEAEEAKLAAIPPRQTQPEVLSYETTATNASEIKVKENLTTYRVGGEEIQKPAFHSLGDQLQAIAGAAISGRESEMLQWESLAAATGSAQAGAPSDGGYLIQKDFATELFSRMSAAGSLANFPTRTIQIGPNSDGLKLNVVDETSRATGSRWGGVQVYWGAENDAATAKKPKFRQMELELKELIGLAYASNRLLQDASALESIFLQAFSEEMSFMKEDALINGTGAGQPKGILSTTGGSATVSVTKEQGQAGNTVVYENLVKMYTRLWARSRQSAVWLINQDVEPQLMQMTLAVGTGGVPVYLPPGGASAAPYGTIFGRPVVPVEYCATLGTVGDIILWDPTQYVTIEKGGMSADQSVHVRFTTNENTFRFITRCDGQPLWNSALTPFKGSNTQSPQITLATRA